MNTRVPAYLSHGPIPPAGLKSLPLGSREKPGKGDIACGVWREKGDIGPLLPSTLLWGWRHWPLWPFQATNAYYHQLGLCRPWAYNCGVEKRNVSRWLWQPPHPPSGDSESPCEMSLVSVLPRSLCATLGQHRPDQQLPDCSYPTPAPSVADLRALCKRSSVLAYFTPAYTLSQFPRGLPSSLQN